MADAHQALRPIRSFVRRESRITPAQVRALAELWPRFGIEISDRSLNFAAIFGRRVPLTCEIGFGDGEALVDSAAVSPERDFVGIDVHRPGAGRLLRGLAAAGLSNVRVLIADAKDVYARIPDASFAEIRLFFPDPWPKYRHHKRRLVQPAFAQLVRDKLAPGGRWWIATDWQDYAEWMLRVLTDTPGLVNVAGVGNYAAPGGARALTKFERRGRQRGREIFELEFIRG